MGEAILVASANGAAGMAAAMAILRAGGSALDAVEAGCRCVEADPQEHSVGLGGYPNAAGQVELDASLMEGTTRRAGAVAALQGYPHPISVARAVLEHLPQHLLLAGQGAAHFAAEHGFEAAELLTPETEQAWRRYRQELDSNPGTDLYLATYEVIAQRMAQPGPETKVTGTVNFLARDRAGHLASAVSTSGWAFKYPGRVGDSALIGAGNYCDDRYGACAGTGVGEWSIRAGMARSVVTGLEFGLDLEAACRRVLQDLQAIPLPPRVPPSMNLIALDRNGSHLGYSTISGETYLWQHPEMTSFVTVARSE